MSTSPSIRLHALIFLASLSLLLAVGCGGSDGDGGSGGGSDITAGDGTGGGTADGTSADASTDDAGPDDAQGHDDAGGDLCADVQCPSTAPYCEDGWANSGSYSECNPQDGLCVQAPGLGPEDCGAQGLACVDGECVDLCEDVVCEPIAPYCVDDETAFGGSATYCVPDTGMCMGEGFPMDCTLDGGTCVDGACTGGDLCNDVMCESTDAYCDGDLAVGASGSACNPDNGECEVLAVEAPEDCASLDLACVAGACVDVACEPTETYYFLDAEGCHSCKCPADGIKDDTTCALTSDTTLCGEVDLCADVVCEPTDGTCDDNVAQAGAMTSCDPETGECVTGVLSLPKDCTLIDEVCLDGACVAPEDALCTPGESFEASDGCNTCMCPESGLKAEAGCTLMACPEQCTEAACGPMPAMPNYLCEDGVTMAGPSDCEMQDGGTCGWTVVTCPETDTCTPGESFEASDGCNTCTCPASGLKAEANCTKMACVCTKAEDCGDGSFCDFATDGCGVWGNGGICAEKPQTCVAGGPGACGCDGGAATNGCELNAGGQDEFQYGGCSMDQGETFVCGEITCSASTEYCAISMNDVAGPMEPAFYNNCVQLIDECNQGDCSCMATDDWTDCYDGSGHTMVFYPGG